MKKILGLQAPMELTPLLDLARNLRNHLGVGGITVVNRMLVYLITYIFTSRSSNHAQVMDDDL